MCCIIDIKEGCSVAYINRRKRCHEGDNSMSRRFSFFQKKKGGKEMETMNTITTLISNMGFPIAVACYLFYAQSQDRKAHKEESEGFAQAINNNTLVMTKLIEKIDSLEDEIQ